MAKLTDIDKLVGNVLGNSILGREAAQEYISRKYAAAWHAIHGEVPIDAWMHCTIRRAVKSKMQRRNGWDGQPTTHFVRFSVVRSPEVWLPSGGSAAYRDHRAYPVQIMGVSPGDSPGYWNLKIGLGPKSWFEKRNLPSGKLDPFLLAWLEDPTGAAAYFMEASTDESHQESDDAFNAFDA